MNNTEILYDGESLRIYRYTRVTGVTLDIVKIATSESVELTQEMANVVLPFLAGFAASVFSLGEEGVTPS